MANPNEQTDPEWSDAFERCAHCGAELPTNEWCPVSTVRAADGSLRVRSFCDDGCEAAWADDGT